MHWQLGDLPPELHKRLEDAPRGDRFSTNGPDTTGVILVFHTSARGFHPVNAPTPSWVSVCKTHKQAQA